MRPVPVLPHPSRAAEPARAPREAGRGGAVRPGRSRQCFSPCSTAIRRDAHLHHLLFSRSSRTLLLRDRAAVATDAADEAAAGAEAKAASGVSDDTSESPVVGGATFRLTQVGGELVLTVLVLAVQQREGVCRRGHGTRLVDALKQLLAKEAAARSLRGRMLAQVPGRRSHGQHTLTTW